MCAEDVGFGMMFREMNVLGLKIEDITEKWDRRESPKRTILGRQLSTLGAQFVKAVNERLLMVGRKLCSFAPRRSMTTKLQVK